MSSVSRAMRCCFSARKKTQRAHVVQAVGELHHDDANVVDHGQQHLADVFGLAGLGSQQVEAADFRDAFDQARDVRTEALDDARRGNARVLDHIVQQGGAQRRDVQLHVRQDVRHFQGMRQVGIAGLAQLRAVLLGGKFERAPKQLDIAGRARLADLFDQFKEARLQRARRALRLAADQRRQSYRFFERRHCPVFYVYLMRPARKEFSECTG